MNGINEKTFIKWLLNPLNHNGVRILREIFDKNNNDFSELDGKIKLLVHFKNNIKKTSYELLTDFIVESEQFKPKSIEHLNELLAKDYNHKELNNSIVKVLTKGDLNKDFLLKEYLLKKFILESSYHLNDEEIINNLSSKIDDEYRSFPGVQKIIK
jgi:hypothetical protein